MWGHLDSSVVINGVYFLILDRIAFTPNTNRTGVQVNRTADPHFLVDSGTVTCCAPEFGKQSTKQTELTPRADSGPYQKLFFENVWKNPKRTLVSSVFQVPSDLAAVLVSVTAGGAASISLSLSLFLSLPSPCTLPHSCKHFGPCDISGSRGESRPLPLHSVLILSLSRALSLSPS